MVIAFAALGRYAVEKNRRIAKDLLAQEQSASVMGATSLGMFLRLSSAWVVFISPKTFRGPLTLNLKRGSADLKHLPTGSSAQISLGNN